VTAQLEVAHRGRQPAVDALEAAVATSVAADDRSSLDVAVDSEGHPAPLVLRHTGEVGPHAAERLRLTPGDALVLHSGVLQRTFDVDGLRTVLARCTGFTADAIAERVETAALAFVDAEPNEDIAIVVIRVPAPTGTGTTASADLPPDTTAPAMARRFIEAVLGADNAAPVLETAKLLTSELVTNAVLHGAAPIRMSVDRRDGTVRVAVADAGDGMPRLLQLGVEATSGRGVQLLDLLADRWGIADASTGTGKSVWFELKI
jgi:anti-sigma regulatory factor (Ser/Thr protein kinase)